jgi:proteasome lid subunit RPN8/RPN11
MKATVRVSRNQLAYFRKLARSTSKEIQALLVGRVVSPELTVIEEFAYPRRYAAQSASGVSWRLDEYEAVKKDAEARGKRVVGDLHSHPEWDAVMSATDAKAHVQDGHRVCGICSTQTNARGTRRTRVRFWIMESALPAEVEYV